MLNNRSTRMQITAITIPSSTSESSSSVSSSNNSKDMTMVRLSRRRPFGLRFLLAIPVLSVVFFVSYVGWTDLIEWRSSCSNLVVPSLANSEVMNLSSSADASVIENESSLAVQSLLAYSRALNEPSSAGRQCVSPTASQADIDTFDIYPRLDFQPEYLHRRDFWDSSLEKRYNDYKTDKTRPPLKVIVLPHSHVDPGWLKTFEDYYAQSTRNILDNMINKLSQHKNMTFIWTEMSFFSMWWEGAQPNKRRQVRQLVDEGRLEFTSASWVMTDEASPHLYSMLDQMIEGHLWLKSQLGVTPKSAWSVDPFGHGPVAPYLLHAAGLQNTVVQRIHYGWKRWMADHQVSDFYWKMPWQSDKPSILCHNFPYDIYSTKHSCGPDPKTCLSFDFRNLRGEYNEFTLNASPITKINVQARAELLLEQYAKTGSLTKHNVVLALVGDDFRYDHELEWDQQYMNYQNMFNHINSKRQLYGIEEIGFGTLSDYFDAVRQRTGDNFPTLKGDFFPYADIFAEGRPAYWTGYFTSRPFYKTLAREVEGRLRGAEILFTISLNRARQDGKLPTALRMLDHEYSRLVSARRWLSLFQHHDAVTGTSKSFVMQDYGQKLFSALEDASKIEALSASILLSGDDWRWRKFQLLPSLTRPSYDKLPQKMMLELQQTQSSSKTVVLYNSDGHFRNEMVRLKINWPYVRVVDPDGRRIRHQINPVWTLQHQRWLEHAPDSYQLVFIAPLPPLSLSSYRIERLSGDDNQTETLVYSNTNTKSLKGPFKLQPLQEADIQVENGNAKLLFDGQTGFIKSIRSKLTGTSTQCAMQFLAYPSSLFHSGAYLFQPDANAQEPQIDVLKGYSKQIFIMSGPVMSEVSVVYNKLIVHSTILFHEPILADQVLMETTLDMGLAPNFREHEFFIRFKTGVRNTFNSSAEFYTDQNGFSMARRMRVNNLGVEANYYPITSSAFIQDDTQRLNLLVNSPKGFTSLNPGWMEFMIDRRTIHDDGRGMGEGMIDNLPTVTPFILLLEPKENREEQVAKLSLPAATASNVLMYPSSTFVVDTEDAQVAEYLTKSRALFLNQPLPCNAHLVGLRTLSESMSEADLNLPSNSALLTVHNRAFECSISDDLPRCSPADRDQVLHPQTAFIGLQLAGIEQTSLTGLHSLGPTDFDSIRIPLMELRSFNLTFA